MDKKTAIFINKELEKMQKKTKKQVMKPIQIEENKQNKSS